MVTVFFARVVSTDVLATKVATLAQWIKESAYFIAFTGAGACD